MQSKLLVEIAETGETFPMRRENSIDILKYELSLLSPTSPPDQILLFGPPYKVLDAHYRPDMDLEGKRVFLFDRRMIADNPSIYSVRLQPEEVSQSEHLRGSSLGETNLDARRLPRKLLDYEMYFRDSLARARCLDSFVRESVASCVKCIERHSVQRDAVLAAIENLREIFATGVRTYEQFDGRLTEQLNLQEQVLDRFEVDLEKLKEHQFHPAIAQAIEAYTSKSVKTLYDIIPIERERSYCQEFRDAHRQAVDAFARVRSLKAALQERVNNLSPPTVNLSNLNSIIEDVKVQEQKQASLTESLRNHYRRVYELMNSLPTPQSDEDITRAVTALAERRRQVEEQKLLPSLEQGVDSIRELKHKLEASQNELTHSVFFTMRRIGALQTEIQNKFKRDVEWMRKWTTGRNQYMSHLQQIIDLPVTYQQFILEISRRRAYNKWFETELATVQNRVANLRREETSKREAFMQQHGARLPLLFLEVVRSLKDKPRYFSPSTTPPEQLPEVTVESIPEELDHAPEEPDLKSARLEHENLLLKSRVEELERQLARAQGSTPTTTAAAAVPMAESSTSMGESLLADAKPPEGTTSDNSNDTSSGGPSAEDYAKQTDTIQALLAIVQEMEKQLLEVKSMQRRVVDQPTPIVLYETPSEIHYDRFAEYSVDDGRSAEAMLQSTMGASVAVSNKLVELLAYPMISIMDFKPGDVAMFMPVIPENREIWMAFNVNSLYRFLSRASVGAFMSKVKHAHLQTSIIAKLIYIRRCVVGEDETEVAIPILPKGTEYFVCDAEPLPSRNSKKPASSIGKSEK